MARDGPFWRGASHETTLPSTGFPGLGSFFMRLLCVERREQLGRGHLRSALLQHAFIENEANDLFEAHAIVEIGEHERPLAAHFLASFFD